MTPLGLTGVLFGVSVAAGFLGALVGTGGGIILVPAMTLVIGIDIRYAIGASIVSVIATSSGSAAAYVRERLANLKVAMFLEVGTTAGALCGAFLAGTIDNRILFALFGALTLYSAVAMAGKLRKVPAVAAVAVRADGLADALGLHDAFFDESTGAHVSYRVANARLGLMLMVLAGTVSGLLGIGAGALKVPALDLAMRLPMKVSTATSNFMIGVTAAASAGVYFARGDIDPFVAGPVAVGVVAGSFLGARLMTRMKTATLRILFVGVLLWVSVGMLRKGLL